MECKEEDKGMLLREETQGKEEVLPAGNERTIVIRGRSWQENRRKVGDGERKTCQTQDRPSPKTNKK